MNRFGRFPVLALIALSAWFFYKKILFTVSIDTSVRNVAEFVDWTRKPSKAALSDLKEIQMYIGLGTIVLIIILILIFN